MATIYEVSELAGVSLATVSRVMNKNARVSDKTAAKVLAAMETLGYRPNSIAQSLASSRTNSVGVLVSEFSGPFFGSMMQGIETRFRASGKHVIIAAGHSDEAKEIEGIEFLISKKCDALILHVESVPSHYLIELAKRDIAFVLVNRYIPEISDYCISLNNELGGYLATKFVLEKGHREIAYISGPLWKCDAKDRYKGHQRALKEFDLSQDQDLFFEGDFHEESGCQGMRHVLAQHKPFTAVICSNDIMALGAITVAREHGLDVPNTLSVMGFDNVMFAGYILPKLTSINYPIYEMGAMAARQVLKQVYKEDDENLQLIFEPKLVERDSVVTYTNR